MKEFLLLFVLLRVEVGCVLEEARVKLRIFNEIMVIMMCFLCYYLWRDSTRFH